MAKKINLQEFIQKQIASETDLKPKWADETWKLGDLINNAAGLFGSREEIVAEAVKQTGKNRHTIQEAARLAREFPPSKRILEFTATHHQEILNYRSNIPETKLAKIIQDAKTGGGGKRKAVPVSVLRKMLQKASGKTPSPSGVAHGLRQAFVYPGEDDTWVAECPSLPGCLSQGKTLEQAVTNIREAIKGHILSLQNGGLPVPEEHFDALLVTI